MLRSGLDTRALVRLERNRPGRPTFAAVRVPEWLGSSALDDRTYDYVLKVRDGFERLEDAVRQLAALLILAAAGGRRLDDHPVRIQARRDLDEAGERLRGASPSRRAAHHHRHLLEAETKTRLALDQPPEAAGTALKILAEAADHLRWAAGALPGFEVVALTEGCGCCAPTHQP